MKMKTGECFTFSFFYYYKLLFTLSRSFFISNKGNSLFLLFKKKIGILILSFFLFFIFPHYY
jgi:hypothetical protein